jgi:nucleoside-diphosphate-sugar epimerase
LGWKAEAPLREGIAKTYEWIEGEVDKWLSQMTSEP